MQAIPKLVIVVAMFAIVLGSPLALYAFLTRDRRRAMRAIREGAAAQGWRFRIRHWLGDPTAFRLDGLTRNGLRWILKTRGASENNRGWTVQLGLRVPDLGGQIDFAILPRDATDSSSALRVSGVSPALQQRIAGFSGTLASAIEFFHDAREFPAGVGAFDSAYHVLGNPKRIRETPVDHFVAEKILEWPAEAISPHTVLIWRDSFGLHLVARLPAPANWSTVVHCAELANDLSFRLPAPEISPAPRGFVDRLVARFMRT